MSDRYGYIAIETLLKYCENSADHVVTPNDFMRMARVRVPERKTGRWLPDNRPGGGFWVCSCCGFPSEAFAADKLYKYCPVCGCRMDEGEQDGR